MALAKGKLNEMRQNPKKVMKVFKLCKNHRLYTSSRITPQPCSG